MEESNYVTESVECKVVIEKCSAGLVEVQSMEPAGRVASSKGVSAYRAVLRGRLTRAMMLIIFTLVNIRMM